MKLTTTLRGVAITGLIALPLLTAGCNPFALNSVIPIDPPPSDIEAQMLGEAERYIMHEQTSILNQTDSGETAGNKQNDIKTSQIKQGELSTVYLQNEHGWIAPVSVPLHGSDTLDSLVRSLELLVKDGPMADHVPEGFAGVLPKDTEVKAVTLKEDERLAVVEFSSAFRNYAAVDERKILEALTWTLTEHPSVSQVQLWVDGELLNEMPVDHTPLDRMLTRALGINLQLGNVSTLTQTSPVTVYFSAATSDGIPYFVPVTRFVDSKGNRLELALKELIKGPERGQGLERVVTDNTTVDNIEISKEGIITLAISDDMFEPGERVPAQMLQSLVLTATENSEQEQVRIRLNGENTVIGLDDLKYSEPVSRPRVINEIPL